MPVCKRCSAQKASAEMRRHLDTWACKDKWTCKERVKAQKAERKKARTWSPATW